MIKPETRAKKLQERIEKEINKAKELGIESNFYIWDDSVKKELRLRANYTTSYIVDAIHYPKNLEGDIMHPLWQQMKEIDIAITKTKQSKMFTTPTTIIEINENLKEGPAKRAIAKAEFTIEHGIQFLDKLQKFSTKTNLKNLRRDISILQSQQKELTPQMRKVNSEFITKRKHAKEEKTRKNQEALTEGRFWECDTDVLKSYFHPPFSKNYLVDVSERWRAALFLECKSNSYKRANGGWGHKLVGTGDGYLCGIDDNGDEWGHPVVIWQSCDEFGDTELSGTVEEAMSSLFAIQQNKLDSCYRQGDLLFCQESIPRDHTLELKAQRYPWEVRESHMISSPTLERNERYFQALNEIVVSHTSHNTVILPAGEYKLYELQIADAD